MGIIVSPLSLRKNLPVTNRVHSLESANLEINIAFSLLYVLVVNVAPPPPYTGKLPFSVCFFTIRVPNCILQQFEMELFPHFDLSTFIALRI